MKRSIHILVFLFTLHGTLTLYTNSSFLGRFLPESSVSLLYAVAAFVSLVGVLTLHKALEHRGNVATALALLCIEALCLAGFALSDDVRVVVPLFILSQAAIALSFVCFDVFLEHVSKDASTGSTRGVYLTIINAAFLLGPVIGGAIIDEFSFPALYGFSALFLVPTMLMIVYGLRGFKDAEYQKVPFIASLMNTFKSRDLGSATLAYLSLWAYYVVMIIYVPVYLTSELGYTYAQVGTILGITLIPFVLFQVMLGRLADKFWGEKELLVIGFAIMAVTTLALPGFAPLGFWYVTMTLFAGRVGACIVEVMCDTYFFKKVTDANVGPITIYRSAMNASYIIVPALALLSIAVAGPAGIFLLAGLIALMGIVPSLVLKDTL